MSGEHLTFGRPTECCRATYGNGFHLDWGFAPLAVNLAFWGSPMALAVWLYGRLQMPARMVFRRALKWLGITPAAFVLYALSYGPVLRLDGATAGYHHRSRIVGFIYFPLLVKGPDLSFVYEDYLGWWISNEDPPATRKGG